MSIFNKDFYPTPLDVIQLMGFDCEDKVVLEPSAGSGNIVDYLQNNGAKDVLTCELSDKLAEIIKRKSRFINDDFLSVTREDVSFIDLIVANPPFSVGVEHVMHMWEIAPDGCEIYTLINHDNLTSQQPPRKARELKMLIRQHGGSINLGACFDNAERKTNVDVGLITLFKPATEESGFDGFFMDDEHEVNTTEGLIKPDKVRDLVERYVDALKEYKEFEKVKNRMNHILKPVGIDPISCEIETSGNYRSSISYESFSSDLQKRMWQHVFRLMSLDKFLTSKVRDKINKFSEQQQKVPFTMKNIYKMVEIIQGTSDNILKEALVEAVDHFTKYTNENRWEVSGWKTNFGHLLGKKFIAEGLNYSYSFGINYGSTLNDRFSDLLKVLCNITATNYDNVLKPVDWISSDMETGKWYDVTTIEKHTSGYKTDIVRLEPIFFTFKFFKKGSIHVKFLDNNVWEMLNRKYAEIKGATLPEKL